MMTPLYNNRRFSQFLHKHKQHLIWLNIGYTKQTGEKEFLFCGGGFRCCSGGGGISYFFTCINDLLFKRAAWFISSSAPVRTLIVPQVVVKGTSVLKARSPGMLARGQVC